MHAFAGWSASLLLWAGCQSGPANPTDSPASHRLAPGQLESQTKLGLRVLRARLLEENLGRASRLAVPAGPHTFGETVKVTITLVNPLTSELELAGPHDGLRIELESRRERWLPQGEKEVLSRNLLARIPAGVVLAPGESQEQSFSLALEAAPAEASSLWVVDLQAHLHLDGVRTAGETLPAHDLRLGPVRMLVFPKGWRPLAEDPLGALRRVLATPSTQVERHLLVCAALLSPEERQAGLAALMDALLQNPGPRRSRSITTALAWLTGREPSQSPAAWYAWWEERQSQRKP